MTEAYVPQERKENVLSDLTTLIGEQNGRVAKYPGHKGSSESMIFTTGDKNLIVVRTEKTPVGEKTKIFCDPISAKKLAQAGIINLESTENRTGEIRGLISEARTISEGHK